MSGPAQNMPPPQTSGRGIASGEAKPRGGRHDRTAGLDIDAGGCAASYAAEAHYSVQQVAAKWGLSDDAVRELFVREPGVLVIGHGGGRGKRAYRTLRIPDSVLQRVHRRLANP